MSDFWTRDLFLRFLCGFAVGTVIMLAGPARAESVVAAPVAAVDVPPAGKLQTAIFAGGCFWGVEGVFSHVQGVKRVVSGYAGGPRGQAVSYEDVSSGTTGFAESVRLAYDPAQVSYGTLLRIFFSVVADPTTLNYQGPDHGTQYRTAIFPLNADQDKVARAYIAQLGKSGLWKDAIVTKVERFTTFVDAEAEHQDFMRRHARHPYIVRWDAPKLVAFRKMFPRLAADTPAR